MDENNLYIAKSPGSLTIDWRMSKSRKATLCKGRLSDIKGAIPKIKNLARSRITKRECGLTRIEKQVIQQLMQRNSTCTYNMSLSSIIED